MYRRNKIVGDVSRFATEDKRATHCYAVVIKNDGRWEEDIAFRDSGCGKSSVHITIIDYYLHPNLLKPVVQHHHPYRPPWCTIQQPWRGLVPCHYHRDIDYPIRIEL